VTNLERLGAWERIKEAFFDLKNNPMLMVYSLLYTIPVGIAAFLQQEAFMNSFAVDMGISAVMMEVISVILTLLSSAMVVVVMQGAIRLICYEQELDLAEDFRLLLRKVPLLIGAGLILLLGYGAAFLMLMIPILGFIILIISAPIISHMFMFVFEIVLDDRYELGVIDSYKFSKTITDGHKMEVFSILFVVGLITSAIAAIIIVPMIFLSDFDLFMMWESNVIFSMVITFIGTPLHYLIQTHIYKDLTDGYDRSRSNNIDESLDNLVLTLEK